MTYYLVFEKGTFYNIKICHFYDLNFETASKSQVYLNFLNIIYVHQFPRSAVANYHQWLKITMYHSSESQQSKIKVSAVSMFSLKTLGDDSSLPLPRLSLLLAILRIPWFVDTSLQFLPPTTHGYFLCVFISFSSRACIFLFLHMSFSSLSVLSKFPWLVRIPVIRLGPTVVSINRSYIDYNCKDPAPKYGHVHGCQGLGL